MSFARYSNTKCLTTREIEDILEDKAFWKDMNNNDVDADEIQIVIVPPEPDELTDIENIEENNLENEEEVKDIAGNYEPEFDVDTNIPDSGEDVLLDVPESEKSGTSIITDTDTDTEETLDDSTVKVTIVLSCSVKHFQELHFKKNVEHVIKNRIRTKKIFKSG
ncbi:hypothetical protein FQA39_LY05985 [Lamprigera yunnana]|nr:hypothetical protein FQA39_LY05985 [Lamprigera yunnana]